LLLSARPLAEAAGRLMEYAEGLQGALNWIYHECELDEEPAAS
jgi:hypothetical protein